MIRQSRDDLEYSRSTPIESTKVEAKQIQTPKKEEDDEVDYIMMFTFMEL